MQPKLEPNLITMFMYVMKSDDHNATPDKFLFKILLQKDL